MRRALAALALTLGMTVSVVAAPLPAQAETCIPGTNLCQGGRVSHMAGDDGYDPSIIVFCNFPDAFTNGEPDPDWSKEKYVAEGTTSNSDCGDDTDVVYIRTNEELICAGRFGWEKVFDATGPHKINDLWDRNCVLTRD